MITPDRIARATAVRCGDAYRALCPTTGDIYLSSIIRPLAGPYVALGWAICDAERQTGDDCDPTQPQYHTYIDGDKA